LDGVNGAAEFRQHAVAGRIGNAASVVSDRLVEDCAALGQPLECSDLIGTHEARIALHVSREDGRQPPLDIGWL
jgi:hypothetical protein